MDRFIFFFAFYGLILGLGVAELLSGFAGMVRAHALKKLEAQTALAALLTFVLICATWVDTFTMDREITLNFGDLWAPILVATFYYLAASVIFPRDPRQFSHLRAYFSARRKFIIGMLFAAELVDLYVNRTYLTDRYYHDPGAFWGWNVDQGRLPRAATSARSPGHDRAPRRADPDLHRALLALGSNRPDRNAPAGLLIEECLLWVESRH